MTDFIQFYTHYDEEGRLKRHRTEFVATTYVLDQLILAGARVLEVGAATGAYSIHFATRGCSVVALDAMARHIDTLRAKLQSLPHLEVQALVEDARDLSAFAAHDFDAVLCMGPVYHVSDLDAKVCLDGCIAALKPEGLLAVSYVNTFQGYERHKYVEEFVHRTPTEIEALLASYDLDRICHVPTDGVVFGELNVITQEESGRLAKLHEWLDQNQGVFKNEIWPDTSIHGLYVGRKS